MDERAPEEQGDVDPRALLDRIERQGAEFQQMVLDVRALIVEQFAVLARDENAQPNAPEPNRAFADLAHELVGDLRNMVANLAHQRQHIQDVMMRGGWLDEIYLYNRWEEQASERAASTSRTEGVFLCQHNNK
ncbi:unnamed protein product [Gongylonema pulchrum]|uniref:Mediator complex subunit 22 n=1 Tax=Gongylonema pulchrum TaxID=637853 RepID=A0A183EIT5_9BILA|nr:unnamed protein product [Gongylonema pulchrum]